MSVRTFHNGTMVLADRLLTGAAVQMENGCITAIRDHPGPVRDLDLHGGYLVPGFVDLHVHGGAGADFMDGTEDAFRAICQAHARHGTTSLLPTTTAASHEQLLTFLGVCQKLCDPTAQAGPENRAGSTGAARSIASSPGPAPREGGSRTGGARILGAHFYGPYFAKEARGCHPAEPIRAPRPEEYLEYLAFGSCISRATVAPELPGAETFVRSCRALGIG